jgi:hypothetical protein
MGKLLRVCAENQEFPSPHMASSRVSSSPLLLVWLLGITQIIGYGTLYYSFAILAADIARDLEWSVAALYGGFSLALIAGGLAAPHAGRMIDSTGAPRLMAAGSVVAALALAMAAMAPNGIIFTLAFIVIEVAATLILYDASFVAIVQLTGPEAQRRIVHLTLIAGFASTIFWPLTGWLDHELGWRHTYLLFALLNLCVCAPLHFGLSRFVAMPPAPAAGTAAKPPPPAAPPLPPAHQPRALFFTTWGFAIAGFVLSAILAQMVPMLETLDFGSAALAIGAAFGPAQVVVRFANLVLGSGRHPIVATLASATLLLAALLILLATAPWLAGGFAFVVLLGFFSGLKSIVNGTLPLALFGSGGFGHRLGRMAQYRLILGAVAPFVFAWFSALAGTRWALIGLAAVAVLSLLAFIEISRLCREAGKAAK